MKTRALFLQVGSALLASMLVVSAAESGTSPGSKDAGKKAQAAPPSVSYAVAEVVRMGEAGIDVSIIQTHLEKSTYVSKPTADEIIYLHEHGISGPLISALIRRGGELQTQAAQAYQESQKAAPALSQPTPPSVTSQPARQSAPIVVTSAAPEVHYVAPREIHYVNHLPGQPRYYYPRYGGFTYSYGAPRYGSYPAPGYPRYYYPRAHPGVYSGYVGFGVGFGARCFR